MARPHAALCSAGICLVFWYPTPPPGSTFAERWYTLRQYVSELMTCVTRPVCQRAYAVFRMDNEPHQTFVTSQIMCHGRHNSEVCNSQLVKAAYEIKFRSLHAHETQSEWVVERSAKDRGLKNNWNQSTVEGWNVIRRHCVRKVIVLCYCSSGFPPASGSSLYR